MSNSNNESNFSSPKSLMSSFDEHYQFDQKLPKPSAIPALSQRHQRTSTSSLAVEGQLGNRFQSSFKNNFSDQSFLTFGRDNTENPTNAPHISLIPGLQLSKISNSDEPPNLLSKQSVIEEYSLTSSEELAPVIASTSHINSTAPIKMQPSTISFLESPRGASPTLLEDSLVSGWNFSASNISNNSSTSNRLNQSFTHGVQVRNTTSRTPGPPKTPDIMDRFVSHLIISNSNSPIPEGKIQQNILHPSTPSHPHDMMMFSPGQEEMVSRLIQSDTPAPTTRSMGSADFTQPPSVNMKPNVLFSIHHDEQQNGLSTEIHSQESLFRPKSDLSYDAEPFDPQVIRRKLLPSSSPFHNTDFPSAPMSSSGRLQLQQRVGRDGSPFIEPHSNSHSIQTYYSNNNNNAGKLRSSLDSVRNSNVSKSISTNANSVASGSSIGNSNRIASSSGNLDSDSLFVSGSSSLGSPLSTRVQNQLDNYLLSQSVTSSFERPNNIHQPFPPQVPFGKKSSAVPLLRLSHSVDLSSSASLTGSAVVTGDLRMSTDSFKSQSIRSSVQRIPISTQAGAQDFVESPRTKTYYKQFQEFFRAHIKANALQQLPGPANSVLNLELVLKRIQDIPEHSRWRCYIDLAELAKKNNDYDQARQFYISACCSERRAMSSWLEWSKMEEENGFPDKAYNILKVALISCSKLNEHLLPRMIKLRERQYRNDRTREWLSMLKYESLEKSWKSILEGSLFEARVGNFHATRDMLKFLRRHVPWYGPLFLEAYRLEEREENDNEALKIIQQGLVELPRYGPLWFGMIHIKERRDILEERCQWQRGMLPLLNQSSADCAAAVVYISRELMWRVYLEKFLIEERALEIAARGMYNHHPYVNLGHSSQRQIRSLIQCRREIGQPQCQRSLCHSLLLCASNLRWKVLLIGVRFELRLGNEGTARKLLAQAYEEIPKKSLSSVIIECSRLEEYLGHINRARKILRQACQELSGDWRLFYEWILLEARQGSSCLSRALEIARTAALRHPSTGRIWALLAQLYHRWEAFRPYHPLSKLASDEAYTMFSPSCSASFTCNVTIQDLQRLFSPREMIVRNAIAEVPKSGEVWCEEGRARMNPLHKHFDLTLAQQSLTFAMQFTPQFGDTLIEYLRLELLIRSCLKAVCRILDIDFDHFVKTFLVFDMESDLFLSLSASSAPTDSGSISTSAAAMTDDSLEPTVIFRKIHQATGSGVPSSVSNSANSGSVKDKRRDIERILQLQYLIEEDIRLLEVISFPQLHRRCLNADPNYGMLWAHCRDLPDDISIRILARAKRILLQELLMSYPLYLRATLLYVQRVLTEEIDAYQIAIVSGVNSTLHRQYHHALHAFIGNESEATRIQWVLDEIRLVQRNHYHSSRSTDPDNSDGEDQEDILNGDHDKEHTAKLKPLAYRVALTGHSFLLSDFSTGCIEINRSIFNPFRDEEQTWQFLFVFVLETVLPTGVRELLRWTTYCQATSTLSSFYSCD